MCFTCRKMFKKTSYSELPKDTRPSTYKEYAPPCPECDQPMHNMGKEFEPPKKSDIKAWQKVEACHREIQRQSMTSPQSWIRDINRT